MRTVTKLVKEVIQKELGGAISASPASSGGEASDVAMATALTPEIQQEIQRLEEEAAALLSRAAYLRHFCLHPGSRASRWHRKVQCPKPRSHLLWSPWPRSAATRSTTIPTTAMAGSWRSFCDVDNVR